MKFTIDLGSYCGTVMVRSLLNTFCVKVSEKEIRHLERGVEIPLAQFPADVQNALNEAKDEWEMRNSEKKKAAKEQAAFKAKTAFTVISGTKSEIKMSRQDGYILDYRPTSGRGWVILIYEGYVPPEKGYGGKVSHHDSFDAALTKIFKGHYDPKTGVIRAKKPGLVIGHRGSTIRGFSRIAGRRLTVKELK